MTLVSNRLKNSFMYTCVFMSTHVYFLHVKDTISKINNIIAFYSRVFVFSVFV